MYKSYIRSMHHAHAFTSHIHVIRIILLENITTEPNAHNNSADIVCLWLSGYILQHIYMHVCVMVTRLESLQARDTWRVLRGQKRQNEPLPYFQSAHVCLYVYIYIYIYIYRYFDARKFLCIQMYMPIRIHTYIHTYIHTCIRAGMRY
jgi:hypothetical protein